MLAEVKRSNYFNSNSLDITDAEPMRWPAQPEGMQNKQDFG